MPDPAVLAGLVVVVFGAGFVNGTIGFGFGVLAVNILAVTLGAKSGVVVVSLIAPVLSSTQIWHYRGHVPAWRRYRILLAGALVGSLIGAQLLVFLPGAAISVALGLFTAWYVVGQLRAERPSIQTGTERMLAPVVGLAAGISNGSLGASGPILGTYLHALGLRAGAFAFAISLIFFSMSMVRGTVLAVNGFYVSSLVITALVLLAPTFVGQRVGFWFHGRLNAHHLQRFILLVLLLASVDLLAQGVRGILQTGV